MQILIEETQPGVYSTIVVPTQGKTPPHNASVAFILLTCAHHLLADHVSNELPALLGKQLGPQIQIATPDQIKGIKGP